MKRNSRFLVKILLISVICLAATISSANARRNKTLWENYKKTYNKTKHGRNETLRQEVFFRRHNFIESCNRGNRTYKVRHNRFSDWTEEELNSTLGLRHNPKLSAKLSATSRNVDVFRTCKAYSSLPKSFDLRTDPCMPQAKNQRSCGSCWAFTALTPVEFSTCKKRNRTTVLSEQQLVDCDIGGENEGCRGGLYTTAWDYLIQTNGSSKESAYPYVGYQNPQCNYESSMAGARVLNYTLLPINNTQAIQLALFKYGPVSAAMYVVYDLFYYESGVYRNPLCNNRIPNHAIVIVGWNVTPDTNISYWIIRNSWGSGWGQEGYFFLELGVDACSIESNVYRNAYTTTEA